MICFALRYAIVGYLFLFYTRYQSFLSVVEKDRVSLLSRLEKEICQLISSAMSVTASSSTMAPTAAAISTLLSHLSVEKGGTAPHNWN